MKIKDTNNKFLKKVFKIKRNIMNKFLITLRLVNKLNPFDLRKDYMNRFFMTFNKN